MNSLCLEESDSVTQLLRCEEWKSILLCLARAECQSTMTTCTTRNGDQRVGASTECYLRTHGERPLSCLENFMPWSSLCHSLRVGYSVLLPEHSLSILARVRLQRIFTKRDLSSGFSHRDRFLSSNTEPSEPQGLPSLYQIDQLPTLCSDEIGGWGSILRHIIFSLLRRSR